MAIGHTTALPPDARQMLAFHLGGTQFDGNRMVAYIAPGRGPRPRTLTVRKNSGLADFFDAMYVTDDRNYYVTANTFSGVKRRNSNAFSLDNIVIDVDAHDDKHIYWSQVDDAINELIRAMHAELFFENILPEPNSIVRTGRGIQFWWKLTQGYAKKGAEKMYRRVVTTMCEWLQDVIARYPEISWLSVDTASSLKLVGLFRMPGTYNYAAGRYATCELCHTYEYALCELAENIPESPAAAARTEEHRVAAIRKRFASGDTLSEEERAQFFGGYGNRRLSWLETLTAARAANGTQRLRNNTLFVCYNTCRSMCSMPHAEAMAQAYRLNRMFAVPLTDREVENCVCTANRKSGYKLSNATIIRLLDISPDEQESIGMFEKIERDKYGHAARARRSARKKAKRDAAIRAGWEKGMSTAQIAAEVGCCAATVRKVLKAGGVSLERAAKREEEPAVEPLKRVDFHEDWYAEECGETVAGEGSEEPAICAVEDESEFKTYVGESAKIARYIRQEGERFRKLDILHARKMRYDTSSEYIRASALSFVQHDYGGDIAAVICDCWIRWGILSEWPLFIHHPPDFQRDSGIIDTLKRVRFPAYDCV